MIEIIDYCRPFWCILPCFTSLVTVDDFGSERGRDQEVEMDSDREAYYIDDPKKALKKFFDREGKRNEREREEG